MQAFRSLTGNAIPFGQENIDTDVIIPARFLKWITRIGLGRAAFDVIRKDPNNVFDDPRFAGAPILIAGDNFGCGSSREHAAWAMVDMGIRVIIAPSFADIFSGNAFKNGILLVSLRQAEVDRLLAIAKDQQITVDLESQLVTTSHQDRFGFEIDEFRKHCLLNGLDEIALTEQQSGQIAAYEADAEHRKTWMRDIAGRSRVHMPHPTLFTKQAP